MAAESAVVKPTSAGISANVARVCVDRDEAVEPDQNMDWSGELGEEAAGAQVNFRSDRPAAQPTNAVAAAGQQRGFEDDIPDMNWVRRLYRGGLSRMDMKLSVVVLCSRRGSPYLREHLADAIEPIIPLTEVVALGPLRANNVYEVVLTNKDVKARLLAEGELVVKGLRCRLVDPDERVAVCRLHWLPHSAPEVEIRRAFVNYGVVLEVAKERSVVQRLRHSYSNVRRG